MRQLLSAILPTPPLTRLKYPLRSRSRRRNISFGPSGTAQTISAMQDLVTKGKRDHLVRNLAGKLVKKCAQKDYYCYAQQVHKYCRDEIHYAFDPAMVEYVESPRRLIEAGIGDCDSVVILFAALCENLGFPCRFVTIKSNPSTPEEFTHVYAEVKLPKHGWVASDPTMPGKAFGWAPPLQYPRKAWPASKDAPPGAFDEDMSGMRGLSAEQIPGVQDTPAVIVEKPYEFREEPAMITATPEQIELETMGAPADENPTGNSQEYWTRSQIHELASETGIETSPALSGFHDEASSRSTVIGIGLIGLGLWAFFGGKK